MARIQHIDPNTTHIGGEHVSEGEGVFDVPDELAAQLVVFPHWRVYDGEPWPHPKTSEELEADRVAVLVTKAVAEATKAQDKELVALRARVAKLDGERNAEPKSEATTESKPTPKRRGRK
jgi:hypothetical protein